MCISRNSWQDLAPYLNIYGVNSLVPPGCESVSKSVFVKLILRIDMLRTSYETSPNWLPQSTIDYMSTMGQVIAWGQVKQQDTIRAKFDLDVVDIMASLGHNGLFFAVDY